MYLIYNPIVEAQEYSPIELGKTQLNLVMFNSLEGTGVFGGVDWMVEKNLTVGFGIGVIEALADDYLFGFNLRTDYHFNRILLINNKWDLYAGGRADFYYSQQYSDSDIQFRLDIGGRRYFGKHLGINFEYGVNPVNIGENNADYVQFGFSYRL